MHKDLRDWLQIVGESGELKKLSGVDCNLEMSAITEIIAGQSPKQVPVIMFDNIPGYQSYRTLFNIFGSQKRLALTLGIPLPEGEGSLIELLCRWREKTKNMKLAPPHFVDSAPFLSNKVTGLDIDLMKFPVPKFHELDGGRYFGTCHGVIQRDPDSGWVNVGTYRVMLVDRNRLALHVLEGQHGGIILYQKYFARKQKMPVALALGMDPALWYSAFTRLPWGLSEFDYTGGIKGAPVEVIEGKYTGLPLPASAEIIIEGECTPGLTVNEGPFGEWNGYYANLGLTAVPEPVIEVKALYFRDEPIFTCQLPTRPNLDTTGLPLALTNSSAIWNRLDASGIPGVKGVWCYSQAAGEGLFIVVSVEQLYPGHSREVGLVASQLPHQGRYTVVVEEDIDPADLEQVIWAISTRCSPSRSIQILEHCRSNSSDPTISMEEKRKYKMTPKPLHNSRVIIDACRPLEWKDEWYPMAKLSPGLKAEIIKKWGKMINDILGNKTVSR